MSGSNRISPVHSDEPITHRTGVMTDLFRRWMQSFVGITNEYFVIVRRKLVGGIRSGAPYGLFQNTQMTTSQRDDIEPVDLDGGMVIFNTTISKLQVYDSTVWVDLH